MGGRLRGVRRFEVEIRQAGEALVIDAPVDVFEAFGTRARVPIAGRLDDCPFDGALVPAGGGHVLFIDRELATRAKLSAGSTAQLWMWRIREPAMTRRSGKGTLK